MLITMGSIYQHRMDLQKASSQHALRRVIDRLLTMNKLIKKRYETKVILLFEAAAFLHALGDGEAATYFAQAEKYYTQQLAYLEGLSLVEPGRVEHSLFTPPSHDLLPGRQTIIHSLLLFLYSIRKEQSQ